MTPATYSRRSQGYLDDALATASPSTLLVMLYDRLLLDLQRAEHAQRDADRETAHRNLIHAQEIVSELQTSLDVESWDGGENLLSLYSWLSKELVVANISGDADRVATARVDIVQPLADAWRQAALEHLSSAPSSSGHGVA